MRAGTRVAHARRRPCRGASVARPHPRRGRPSAASSAASGGAQQGLAGASAAPHVRGAAFDRAVRAEIDQPAADAPLVARLSQHQRRSTTSAGLHTPTFRSLRLHAGEVGAGDGGATARVCPHRCPVTRASSHRGPPPGVAAHPQGARHLSRVPVRGAAKPGRSRRARQTAGASRSRTRGSRRVSGGCGREAHARPCGGRAEAETGAGTRGARAAVRGSRRHLALARGMCGRAPLRRSRRRPRPRCGR